ncbi:MAG: hypothetical protein AABN33_20940 [Acidobacteriota bacterium]
MNGYLHPDYAESLAEFGNPRQLRQCGGWILIRQITAYPYKDAMGCYPLFACRDWSRLHSDLENLEGPISLSLVTDPFGEYTVEYLETCFDIVAPFKQHFITDLNEPSDATVSKHHQYYARKALRIIAVEVSSKPIQFLDEWVKLYADLIERHDLRGIKAFSTNSFARQLSIPGAILFRAVAQNTTVGAQLWYVQGGVGYSHLLACNSAGYKLRAAYALYSTAIKYFANELRWLDLGANAGIMSNGTDGLARFKKGWSTGTRMAYFCGRVFDRERYAEIVKAMGTAETSYFPAYRKGELV